MKRSYLSAIAHTATAALALIVGLIGGAVCAEERVARLGVVFVAPPALQVRTNSSFWARLKELGWIKGQNLLVEEHSADGRVDRLPALMKEVVAHNVDVIVTASTPAALAAKKATDTIPIVVISMGDPVGTGLANNLARPGGNLTGLSTQATDGLPGKWLELMREALPRLFSVAVISNPTNPLGDIQWRQLQEAAPALRIKLSLLRVRKAEDLAPALKQAHTEAQAALVLTDPLTYYHRREIVALASKYRVPAMYTMLEFADEGGLIAHGVDHTPLGRRAADYVDKILRGTKPGDLPIEQASEFKLAVNLKTAQTLGINIAESIRLRADEVIR